VSSIDEPTYHGSCHCGRIAFECHGTLGRVSLCNCAICAKQGFMHWLVPRASFRLLTPLENVATYTFTTARAKHRFCGVCGTAPFTMPRAHPGSVDVNVRCLEGVDFATVTIDYADSRLRHAAHSGRGRSDLDA
jgi:hypothetical protein